MRQKFLPALLLLLLFPSPLSADTDCIPKISPSSITDVRHGIPAAELSARLIRNPQPVTPVIFTENQYDRPGFWTLTDFHALYPIEMKYFARSISDVPNEAKFVPHLTESSLLCSTGSNPVYFRQKARFDFDYIFYRTYYVCILELFLGKSADGKGICFDYQMESALEGSLSFVAGSWYLEPVVLEGKPYTYSRYYLMTSVVGIPGIVKFLIRSFPGIEMPAIMNAYFNHAMALRDADR
jgi:hypothetical protein